MTNQDLPLVGLPPPLNNLRPASTQTGSLEFDEPTGELGLKVEWWEEKVAYAKFSRGYKAGNLEFLSDGTINSVAPEIILAYEIASKNRLFDDRLHLNLTWFYYDYQDLQVPLIQGLDVVTENAAEATIWGIEVETTAQPFWDLYVQATFSYLNARFDSFCTNDAAQPRSVSEDGCLPPTAGLLNLAGNQPEDSPAFKVTLLANYPFDLGKYGTLTPVLKFTFTDEYFLRPFNCGACFGNQAGFANPNGIDFQPWFTRTDIRLQWHSEAQRFFAEVFIENAENETVYQRVVVGSSLNGGLGTGFGLQQPRIYGLRFGVTLEGI